MKPKDLVLISLLFLSCIGLTADIVKFQLTGQHVFDNKSQPLADRTSARCTSQSVPAYHASKDPQLSVLPEYDKVCDSAFVDDMMLFTDMPISEPDARQAADKMAVRLKEFQTHGVAPIVIMEPDSSWGLVDFEEYAAGNYDKWMNAYFAQLKVDGITDKEMGLWVPFPEPQQPNWNNVTPDNFALSFNRYSKLLRSYFPHTKTGILLDSQVGEDGQRQLLAYVRLIDNSLVDVAGLQGFPWYPSEPVDTRKAVTSASQFIPADMLEEVAKALNVKQVLLNTGTFRNRKVANGGNLAVPLYEREKTLNSVLEQTAQLKRAGYDVTVNIFAQNKFNTQEGVDWSYWQPGKAESSEETPIFTNFVRAAKRQGVKISLFDSRP